MSLMEIIDIMKSAYMDMAISDLKKGSRGKSIPPSTPVRCSVCGERHKTLRKKKDGTYICIDCYNKEKKND